MHESQRRGAACEYIAAAEFSKRGWTIFWTPTGSSAADFLIDKKGTTLKVQVKSASWSEQGGSKYLRAGVKARRKYTKDDYDLLVVVDPDERIWSIPFEEVPKTSSIYLEKNQGEIITGYGYEKWIIPNLSSLPPGS